MKTLHNYTELDKCTFKILATSVVHVKYLVNYT